MTRQHSRNIFGRRWRALALAMFALSPLAGLATRAHATAAPDISGIYWANAYSSKIQPLSGGDPPYKPAAMAEYKKNMAALNANPLDDMARSYCVPDGVPRILASPYPFEIVQVSSRGEIFLLYELNHVVRYVQMNTPMPSPQVLGNLPFFSGHSVGHWEGDTLVIETAGYNDRTFLDNSGAPHTDQLHTVERIRKIDGGKALEDIVTIRDPGVFTKEWSARFVYQSRPDIRIMDFNCGEKHRDLSSVKGVRPQ